MLLRTHQAYSPAAPPRFAFALGHALGLRRPSPSLWDLTGYVARSLPRPMAGQRRRGGVVPHVRGEGRWPPRLFRLEQQRGPVRGAGRPRPGQRHRGNATHVRGEGRWPMAYIYIYIVQCVYIL